MFWRRHKKIAVGLMCADWRLHQKSVEFNSRIARQLKVDGVEIKPEVTGDFYRGHTIRWRMPLARMLMAREIVFEADFSAIGSFKDVTSAGR